MKSKNKERKENGKFYAAIGALAVALAALGAYVIVDHAAEKKAQTAREELYASGLESSIAAMNNDLAAGRMILAYYHAREAEDYAGRLGDDAHARRLSEISSQILDGGQGAREQIGDQPTGEDADDEEAEAVSADVPEEAEKCASRFFGGDVITVGRRRENGDILFSRSNAYAIIDGETCVPIEAAISLDSGEPSLSDGECVSSALKFVRDFFPEEVYASAGVSDVRLEDEHRLGVTVDAAGIEMKITVRRDSGRVVRFVSTAR